MIKYIIIIALLLAIIISAQETNPLSDIEKKQSIENNLLFENDNQINFLIYRGFIVNYNYDMKCPNFTIHRININNLRHSEIRTRRRSTFFVDDNLLGLKSANNNDYKGAKYDKGHLVPSADFNSDQIQKNETFVYSNICPQLPSLNTGKWALLEDIVRNIVFNFYEDAIIISGTYFLKGMTNSIGKGDVGVPTYLYKIIYFAKMNKMYAFLFSNDSETYEMDLIDYQVTVDEIEKTVNEDFFDRLPDNIEFNLEKSKFKLDY